MRPPLFLLRWRDWRARVQGEAATLITFLGEMAYDEARGRARACRAKKDGKGDRLWSEVAVRIVERTGREVGVKAADRYERERMPQGSVQAGLQHELALATGAIHGALAEIACGRNVRTELHNVSAHVRNAEALVTPDAPVPWSCGPRPTSPRWPSGRAGSSARACTRRSLRRRAPQSSDGGRRC